MNLKPTTRRAATMTPHQIDLVRQSWAALGPRAPEVATAFYARLFELDPRVAAWLAHVGLEEHARKFTEAMTALVESLDDPERFVPMLARLGRDHAVVGVTERQYRLFGVALLCALQTALHPSWQADMRDAWAETYVLAVSIMQRAGARLSGATGGIST
jgi:hemoglobin-like flavoprotein